ncbi:MAG: hypothetical protein OXC26_04005 [Albidovulum sp.]|nr:hypothetical protein [Albidovulum sp.]
MAVVEQRFSQGKGRIQLDCLTICCGEKFPIEGHEPSLRYSKLPTLPWRDAYAAKYDTPLERASVSVTLKHYNAATNKEI